MEKNCESFNTEMIEGLFKKMDLKMRDIETVQCVPINRPRRLFVELHAGIELGKYCRNECFRLGQGIKTGLIRPKNKREVEVLIKGLDIDTPDGAVLQYLSFFGKVVKHEVIYCKYTSGPLNGMKNGDRKYLIDFSEGRGMGNYHLIDGASSHVTYYGQRRTCGRCHNNANNCPGGAIAKKCEEYNGPKVKLSDHMLSLWSEIGYKPSDYVMSRDEDDKLLDEITSKDSYNFTPEYK